MAAKQSNSAHAAPQRPPRTQWTESQLKFLRDKYPTIGLFATAKAIGRSVNAVRGKASDLGIKIDQSCPYFKEWQSRAAASKVGKKRPAQAAVMKRNHDLGLFLKTPEQCKAIGDRMRKHIAENGHPRGALGMKHSPETLLKLSKKSKDGWKNMTAKRKQEKIVKMLKTKVEKGNLIPPKHGSWKAAWREVGGQRVYFRSRWEANYARFLEWQKARGDIAKWEHEPETFWFDGVKRGCVSYLPDFRVTFPCGRIEYHEVKGWMDPKSKTKIKRMKKYHPKITLIVIDTKQYRQLEKTISTIIEGWETK